MPSDKLLRDLVTRVAVFHITDRTMLQEQREILCALDSGNVDADALARYRSAVHRYFSGFESEARTHLRDIDRRLEALHQVEFNLGAERAVAVKRIEAASSVVHDLAALDGMPA